MVKPVLLAAPIFRHDTDGLALLDYIATYDANGPCVLSRSYYITCFVLRFFDEVFPLLLDRLSLVVAFRFSIRNPLHFKTFLLSNFSCFPDLSH